MSEPNTTTVKCRDCDTMVTRLAGRGHHRKRLCDSCLRESQRKASREYHQRKRAAEKAAQPARTCLDCPADLTHEYARMLRCEPCRREIARAYQQSLRDARPKVEREFFCIRCEVKIERVGNSGLPLYCPTHKAESYRESSLRSEALRTARRASPRFTHCHYCGVKFDTPRRRAKAPSRCDECKKDRHRAYIRIYLAENPRGVDHERRARKLGVGYERFKVKEIFERDRWKCGICRKRISRRLRWPDPMSVSLDHKVPLAKGGSHSRLNVQAAHLRCNLRKRTAVAPLGEQIPLPF